MHLLLTQGHAELSGAGTQVELKLSTKSTTFAQKCIHGPAPEFGWVIMEAHAPAPTECTTLD